MIACIGGPRHDRAGRSGRDIGARCRCRCRCRRRRTAGVSDFQSGDEEPRLVATREGRSRTVLACLNPACFQDAFIINYPIQDVEACVVLVQGHFKVGCTQYGISSSHAPFNVKDPVRRRSRDRGENAAATCKSRAQGVCVRAQAAPIRLNGRVQKKRRQRADVAPSI
jgi:hypothetical protein